MNPDDLTAALPSPRDDEPASLRQDIVDELSDHLHCACNANSWRAGGVSPPILPPALRPATPANRPPGNPSSPVSATPPPSLTGSGGTP